MNKYLNEILIIILLITVALCGVFSLDFTNATFYMNQYGDSVKLFGSGIYKADSYFKATIFIGTDIAVLLFVVPVFIMALVKNIKNETSKTQLRLLSIEAISLYYAASLCFGVKYNRIFVLYVALFALLFFTLISRISSFNKNQVCYNAKKSDYVFLVFSGISLCIAWWPDIIPTIINSTSLSLIENYTTEATYILDLGIISPLCFIAIYLLRKNHPMGTTIYAILLQSIIVVAVMMITQSAFQYLSGVDLPLPALISKSMIFVILGLISLFLDKKLYKTLKKD